MEERFIEIRFYYYIKKLFAKFRDSMYVADIIQAYCNIGDIDSSIIKAQIRWIRQNKGLVSTYADEAVYVARKIGISYRQLAKQTGVSVATQCRLNKEFDMHPERFVNLTRRTDDETFNAIKRFMLIVDILKEV